MTATRATRKPLHRSRRLWDITTELRDLAHDLENDGLSEEAQSLETTIRDLDWQGESLLVSELADELSRDLGRPSARHLTIVR